MQHILPVLALLHRLVGQWRWHQVIVAASTNRLDLVLGRGGGGAFGESQLLGIGVELCKHIAANLALGLKLLTVDIHARIPAAELRGIHHEVRPGVAV
eukprot:CAMPEP_0115322828 /NCGR_PEP_ID=MMETSP0270-20121206/81608_1 /TAXON_ID=71861 /ORGANISM="Scrippsiella trochoidea, Strain CCMP3099" /LENGTH=97 /DNA_ID=CAMNT_0002742815 /DNA_START=247 /DNA_END=540 /DNA_ORIENTATION=-